MDQCCYQTTKALALIPRTRCVGDTVLRVSLQDSRLEVPLACRVFVSNKFLTRPGAGAMDSVCWSTACGSAESKNHGPLLMRGCVEVGHPRSILRNGLTTIRCRFAAFQPRSHD